jgi:hypothetical protein
MDNIAGKSAGLGESNTVDVQKRISWRDRAATNDAASGNNPASSSRS